MAHRTATDEICVKRGMGNHRQAAGGESSESPPAVFWLQKTLLANQIATLTFSGLFQPNHRIADAALQGAWCISKRGGCGASVEPAVGIKNGNSVGRKKQRLLFP